MTDVDDAGLVEVERFDLYTGESGPSICTEPDGRYVLFDDYEAQRREIEELRRERDAARNEAYRIQTRLTFAQIALGEALNVMEEVRDICTFDVKMDGSIYTGTNASACMRAYNAASAFAAKHGGRDE